MLVWVITLEIYDDVLEKKYCTLLLKESDNYLDVYGGNLRKVISIGLVGLDYSLLK